MFQKVKYTLILFNLIYFALFTTYSSKPITENDTSNTI